MRCYRADRPYAAKQKPAGYARRLPFKICEGALAFEDGVFDAFVKDFVGIRALVDRVGGLERGAALAALDVREARALADARKFAGFRRHAFIEDFGRSGGGKSRRQDETREGGTY